jgi:hypothetical protein
MASGLRALEKLMPRKTFLDGDTLPASDINSFLMEQAVQTYATGAARNTALGVPAEGQVTFTADSKNLSTYSTQWRPLPYAVQAGTVTITGTGAVTASGAIVFTASRFGVAPNLQATCTSNNAMLATVGGISTTGATVTIRLTTGGTFTSTHTVDWVATSMTATTSAG